MENEEENKKKRIVIVLQKAIQEKQYDLIDSLLKDEYFLNKPRELVTSFRIALEKNDEKAVKKLLNIKGMEKEFNLKELLNIAIKANKVEMVQLLLDYEYDDNKKNKKKLIKPEDVPPEAFTNAVENDNITMVKLLLQNNIKPSNMSEAVVKALNLNKNNVDMVNLLISMDTDNQSEYDYDDLMDPFFMAIMDGNFDMVKLLLDDKRLNLHHLTYQDGDAAIRMSLDLNYEDSNSNSNTANITLLLLNSEKINLGDDANAINELFLSAFYNEDVEDFKIVNIETIKEITPSTYESDVAAKLIPGKLLLAAASAVWPIPMAKE
jgi:hypothetical protein